MKQSILPTISLLLMGLMAAVANAASSSNWEVMGIHTGMKAEDAKAAILRQWPKAQFVMHQNQLFATGGEKFLDTAEYSARPGLGPLGKREEIYFQVNFNNEVMTVAHVKSYAFSESPNRHDIVAAFDQQYGADMPHAIGANSFTASADGKVGQLARCPNPGVGQVTEDGSASVKVGAARLMAGLTGLGLADSPCYQVITYGDASWTNDLNKAADYSVELYSAPMVVQWFNERQHQMDAMKSRGGAAVTQKGNVKF